MIFGEAMLQVYVDSSSGDQWDTATEYNAVGEPIVTAEPSAVLGYSEECDTLIQKPRRSISIPLELFGPAGRHRLLFGHRSFPRSGSRRCKELCSDTYLQEGQDGAKELHSSTIYTETHSTSTGATVYPVDVQSAYQWPTG